jgi:cysteine desulfurase
LRAGAFCTYEYIRKLKAISDEEDARIAADVDRGVTRNIPTIIRASFAIYNSIDDCNRFVQAIVEICERGPEHYLARYKQDDVTGFWSLRDPGELAGGWYPASSAPMMSAPPPLPLTEGSPAETGA